MPHPKLLTLRWDGPNPGLTFPTPLHHVPPTALLAAPLDVRNFLPPPPPPALSTSTALPTSGGIPMSTIPNITPPHFTLTLAPSRAIHPTAATTTPASTATEPLWTHYTPSIPTTLIAPGRTTFPVSIGLHVVRRAEGGYKDELAAGVAREAWIRVNRLNRLARPPVVPHWWGVYAGIGECGEKDGEEGVGVPVYVSLVGTAGGQAAVEGVTLEQRDAILHAYKQIHDAGVVHRAARPQNWILSTSAKYVLGDSDSESSGGYTSDASGDAANDANAKATPVHKENKMPAVTLAEFGRAHIRRRGFGSIPRELENAEWILDEIQFDAAVAAEMARVRKILCVQ